MNRRIVASVCVALNAFATFLLGQRAQDPVSAHHPAIDYRSRPTTDAVAELNRTIQNGQAQLKADPTNGYLRSVLDALNVPVESQMLVYSETSLQSAHITQARPRALYFSDTVAVGWVQGADTIEVSALDPQQGVGFYQLSQTPAENGRFARNQRCLECHEAPSTLNVPGLLTMSMLPLSDDPNEYAVGWPVDHRTPMKDRWGGWFVTGASVPNTHLGNVPVYHVTKSGVRAAVAPKLASVKGPVHTTPYLTPYSDVVALMVLNHQTRMTNLITRMNWVTRVGAYEKAARTLQAAPKTNDDDPVVGEAAELVDYMLFVDEAPLTGRVQGSSGFAETFTSAGPRDSKGRSLRALDLQKRLLRYPCSYMIYSDAFEALPARAKNAIYDRMWQILSGQVKDPAYATLSAADRQTIIEILRDTKKDLPQPFRQPVRR